jgi:hypothetical protein
MATITIQAENLTLGGDYRIQNSEFAQGGQLIRIGQGLNTGTASISLENAGAERGDLRYPHCLFR